MPRRKGPDEPSDRVRVEHITLAAKEIELFANGRTRADLDKDRQLVRALVHAVMEIGEAARNVR